jgi:hypothetical protein
LQKYHGNVDLQGNANTHRWVKLGINNIRTSKYLTKSTKFGEGVFENQRDTDSHCDPIPAQGFPSGASDNTDPHFSIFSVTPTGLPNLNMVVQEIISEESSPSQFSDSRSKDTGIFN